MKAARLSGWGYAVDTARRLRPELPDRAFVLAGLVRLPAFQSPRRATAGMAVALAEFVDHFILETPAETDE